MRESIFLNKTEMVSFSWVDVEIGRGGGDFLYPLYLLRGRRIQQIFQALHVCFLAKVSICTRGNR
jgi:hypothetical protein